MRENLIHGGDWAGFADAHGRLPLDFSASISPLGVPTDVQAALRDAAAQAAEKVRVGRALGGGDVLKVHVHAGKALFPHHGHHLVDEAGLDGAVRQHLNRPLAGKAAVLRQG